MVLLKLDKLSESELRSIAEQENIEDYLNLGIDDLISRLTEKYEEEDDNFGQDEDDKSLNTRYVSGITDYREISESIGELPGVEELPEVYSETSIHLLYKNHNWGYAYWSVSQIDKDKFDEEGKTLSLLVSILRKDGKKDQYYIDIKDEDREWNIAFSSEARSCRLSLVSTNSKGEKEIVTSSNVLRLPSSYWLEHKNEIVNSDGLFKVYLSFLTNKNGELIKNEVVKEIVEEYLGEDNEQA